MKKTQLACLATALSMFACNPADESPSTAPQTPEAGKDAAAEGKIYEARLSPTSTFEVYEEKDGYSTVVEFHVDKDADLRPELEAMISKPTLVEAFQAAQRIHPTSEAMPAAFARLDAASAKGRLAREERAKGPVAMEELQDAVPMFRNGLPSLAKSAAQEPDWDWDGDCEWWKNFVRTDSPLQHEHFACNMESAWAQRNGFQHTGAGLAASHIAPAFFKSLRRSCGLFECSWEDKLKKDLAPRKAVLTHIDHNTSQGHVLRKFELTGKEPSKRVHLGVMWNTDKNRGTPSPADLTITINSFRNDNLKYTVTNLGSTTIVNPVVRRNLTPTANDPISDERITVTLAPGQSVSRNVFVPAPMFHAVLTVDPNNAIQESNELNNQATASEQP